MSSIPGLGRSPQGGNDNPLQYSCLENPHGQRSLVGYSPEGSKSQTQLKQLSMHTHTHTWVRAHTHTHIYKFMILMTLSRSAHRASEQCSPTKTTPVSPKANTTSLLDQMGVTHSLEYLQHGTPVSHAGCGEGSFKDIEDTFPGFKELSICVL